MNTCSICGKEIKEYDLCDDCEAKGWWVDPAGGIHSPDDDDPAKMYE